MEWWMVSTLAVGILVFSAIHAHPQCGPICRCENGSPERGRSRRRRRPLTQRLVLVLVVAFAVLPLAGCVGYRAANTALEQYDPAHGYRPTDRGQHRDSGKIIILLAFSGGGTRAAAFAYGVLEGLRETQIAVDGIDVSLLEEVDTISGVSGGSFPAAYYGLFGDRQVARSRVGVIRQLLLTQ